MSSFLSRLFSFFKADKNANGRTRLKDGTVSDEWLVPLWEGSFESTFTYCGKTSGRERRTVTVTSVRQDMRGEIYFRGMCHARNEERTFNIANIKTKLTIDGKKYDAEQYLKDVCGVDTTAVHSKVQARRDEEKAKVRERLKAIWTGKENIYFRYVESEHALPIKVDITLTEVAVSKSDIVFLIEETPDKLNVYDTRKLSSDIYYENQYVMLYAFLMQILHLSDKDCGLRGLWGGEKNILITYSSENSGAKKQPTTIEAVVKNRENTVLLVLKGEGDEYYKFVPACDVSSIYDGETRYGPKKFFENCLGLYGIFDKS